MLTIRNNSKRSSQAHRARATPARSALTEFLQYYFISTPKEKIATNRNKEATKALNLPPKTYHFDKRQFESHCTLNLITRREGLMHFARWTHVTKSTPVPGSFHFAGSPLTINCRLGWISYSKMAAPSPSIPQLFTELDRFGKDGNFEKAQKIANKSKPDFSSPP